GRGDREVAGAEPLADGDDVRLERKLLVGEPAARSAHAGHDLIEADEEPVLAASLVEAAPESLGRGVGRLRSGADRLAGERGDGVAGLVEQPVELGEGRLAGRVLAERGRRDVE